MTIRDKKYEYVKDNFIPPPIQGFSAPTYVGKGFARYTFTASGGNYIPQTGSLVATVFNVTDFHYIDRIELLVSTSAGQGTPDNTGCTISLTKLTYLAGQEIYWATPTNVLASSFVETFGEGYEEGQGTTTYTLNTTATNTDQVGFSMIIYYENWRDYVTPTKAAVNDA